MADTITASIQAFPQVRGLTTHDNAAPHTKRYSVESVGGMSLRDYFAAKAMPEVMDKADQQKELDWPTWCRKVAEASYDVADAMLKARG